MKITFFLRLFIWKFFVFSFLVVVAQSVSALTVSITTQNQPNACDIQSVSNVAFGNYNVFSSATVISQGNVVIRCSRGSRPYTVIISLAPGNSGTTAQRYMKRSGGTDQFKYNLYADPARTDIWGEGSAAVAVTVPNKNQNTTFTIYGKISSTGQDVTVGSYTD